MQNVKKCREARFSNPPKLMFDGKVYAWGHKKLYQILNPVVQIKVTANSSYWPSNKQIFQECCKKCAVQITNFVIKTSKDIQLLAYQWLTRTMAFYIFMTYLPITWFCAWCQIMHFASSITTQRTCLVSVSITLKLTLWIYFKKRFNTFMP